MVWLINVSTDQLIVSVLMQFDEFHLVSNVRASLFVELKTGWKHEGSSADRPHRWVSSDRQVSPGRSFCLFLFFCSRCDWLSWLRISVPFRPSVVVKPSAALCSVIGQRAARSPESTGIKPVKPLSYFQTQLDNSPHKHTHTHVTDSWNTSWHARRLPDVSLCFQTWDRTRGRREELLISFFHLLNVPANHTTEDVGIMLCLCASVVMETALI